MIGTQIILHSVKKNLGRQEHTIYLFSLKFDKRTLSSAQFDSLSCVVYNSDK